jgi:hypothetical protein
MPWQGGQGDRRQTTETIIMEIPTVPWRLAGPIPEAEAHSTPALDVTSDAADANSEATSAEDASAVDITNDAGAMIETGADNDTRLLPDECGDEEA